MAKKLPAVDALLVGFGWTGAIIGQELTDAGLNVLALNAAVGAIRRLTLLRPSSRTSYAIIIASIFQEPARETLTFRNSTNRDRTADATAWDRSCPARRRRSGIHWNGQNWRFLPSDFVARTHNTQRYGATAIPDGNDDPGLGRHLRRPRAVLRQVGVSLRHFGQGRQHQGKNPAGRQSFRRARVAGLTRIRRWSMTYGPMLFAQAAKGMGLNPFPAPSANMSRAYTNPLGVQLGPCTYCGFCEKFACGNYSKASPQTTILPVLMRKKTSRCKTESEVVKINLDSSGKRAVSVTYVDLQGEEYEQPADLIIMSRLHPAQRAPAPGVGHWHAVRPPNGQGHTWQKLRVSDRLRR